MENSRNKEICIAIPTYMRDDVLIQTILSLHRTASPDVEIIIVDQSPEHTPKVMETLLDLEANGRIRRILQSVPSIVAAMNCALIVAESRVVLFLDDDIDPLPGLLDAHLAAHSSSGATLIAGRVLQPWHEGLSDDKMDGFASATPSSVTHFMGGNFSVNREIALLIGGFDENFKRAAYQFEAEFAHRLLQVGYKIHYEPAATIRHLKAPTGGTRKFRSHLTTLQPDHSVGAYYFIFRTKRGSRRLADTARRLCSSVMTRHHAQRPWWIPVTLISEIRGMIWAVRLAVSGPKLVDKAAPDHQRARFC